MDTGDDLKHIIHYCNKKSAARKYEYLLLSTDIKVVMLHIAAQDKEVCS
jgi:hypothetical protein